MESVDFAVYTTTLKHSNDRAIVKLSFKKRIRKNTSFRKLHIFCYSSEFSVRFFVSSISMSIKFEFIVNIYSYTFKHFILDSSVWIAASSSKELKNRWHLSSFAIILLFSNRENNFLVRQGKFSKTSAIVIPIKYGVVLSAKFVK